MQPEGSCKWKIPVTPSGIEPATFRLVGRAPPNTAEGTLSQTLLQFLDKGKDRERTTAKYHLGGKNSSLLFDRTI